MQQKDTLICCKRLGSRKEGCCSASFNFEKLKDESGGMSLKGVSFLHRKKTMHAENYHQGEKN